MPAWSIGKAPRGNKLIKIIGKQGMSGTPGPGAYSGTNERVKRSAPGWR